MTPRFQYALQTQLVHFLRGETGEVWTLLGEGLLVSEHMSILLTDTEDRDYHVDIGLAIRLGKKRAIVWDCTSGIGLTDELCATDAFEGWRRTSWTTVREWFDPNDRRTYHSDDIPGWHAMCSDFIGRGQGDGAEYDALKSWLRAHGPLSAVANEIAAELSGDAVVHGIKFMAGNNGAGRLAEVRIDGDRSERATRALDNLGWVTPSQPGFIRCYALLSRPGSSPASKHQQPSGWRRLVDRIKE